MLGGGLEVTRTLPDYLKPGLDLVLVGINPGLRSMAKGHHFAGAGNKFWDLLFDSGIVPRRMTHEEDHLLLTYGIGITNLVARASRSSSELTRRDYEGGRKLLLEKLRRFRPRVAAFVGITVFRELWPGLSSEPSPRRIPPGRRPETVGDTVLFVLPNPSGRNAHFSYGDMLREWRALAAFRRSARA
jgi:TDG/mug DNA glycosylase family protein